MLSLFRLVIGKIMLENPHTDLVKTVFKQLRYVLKALITVELKLFGDLFLYIFIFSCIS